MALITRPGKVLGGTSVVEGQRAYASDWNGDIDVIITDYNGNIDNNNIDPAAAIEPTKIDGYSDSAAEANTLANPGATDAPSLATTIAGELERLRYTDLTSGLGAAALYDNGTTNATPGSWDGVRVGHNLVQNGSLQLQSGGAGTAPDGWTLVATPSTLTLTAAVAAEGSGQIARIVCNGGAEGISQTIRGLKASALYVIGCRARAVTNAGTFAITGGLAAGAFRNASRTIDVAAGYTTYALAVKATATPGDIVISLTTGATAADEIYVHDVFMYEIAKDAKSEGTQTADTARLTTETDVVLASGGGDSWVAITGTTTALDVTVRPDKNNQRVVFSAVLNVMQAAGAVCGFIRLTENGTAVAGPYPVPIGVDNTNETAPVVFHYLKENPAPGTALAYVFEVRRSNLVGRTYRFASLDTGADPIQRSCDLSVRVEDIR